MNQLQSRLAHALAVRQKSPAALARATGATESAVSQWLSGETKSVRAANLMAICSFLDCNPQWMASNKGPSGLDKEVGAQVFALPERGSDVNQAVLALGKALAGADDLARGQAALVLQELAKTPDRAAEWADRLQRTLNNTPEADSGKHRSA